MTSIDERVVQMRFDSKGFESGVSRTMGLLGKLKSVLKLDGATKGLENVQNTANKGIGLNKISDAVGQISGKFRALSVAGVAALATIASKATMAGLNFVKSFTFQPIMDGFNEYELKMGSIQTILANTQRYGTTLPQVSKSLNELNTYADKTIYNFGDMTKNIGLFTNAGIKLQDATSMIKGFSNAAAASGTSSEGAASAAYQLSQALSAGKITLMDWRSLQNVGMGNKNMQTGIIKIADAMGTMKKAGVSASSVQKDFNGSLQKGWLKADVMSNYLKIMAGDMSDAQMKALGLDAATIKMFHQQQKTAEDAATKVRTFSQLMGTLKEAVGSGWATTFETVFGNFDEATVIFTKLSNTFGNIINNSAKARNKVLGDWKKLGGRDLLIGGFENAGKALGTLAKTIRGAFRDIFPPMTGEKLAQLTQSFEAFTSDVADFVSGHATQLRDTFKGIFAILDIGWTIIKKVAGVIGDLFGQIGQGSGSFLDITAKIGQFLVKLDEAIKHGKGFNRFFEVLSKVIQIPIKAIGLLIGFIADLFSGFDSGGKSIDRFSKRLSPLQRIGGALKGAFSHLTDSLGKFGDVLEPVGQKFADFFKTLPTKIAEWLSGGDYSTALDTLNTGIFAMLTLAIRKFLKGGLSFKADIGGGGFLDTIKESFEGLTGTMKTMQAQLKAKTLLEIAGAIALITASVVALSLIDSDKLTKALAGLGVAFTELMGAMVILEKMTKSGSFARMPFVAGSLILLAAAIDLLVLAVIGLSKLSWEELIKGLGGVVVLLGGLAAVSKPLSKNSKGMLTAGAGLLLLAGAISILASAVKKLGDMDLKTMAKGLTGVAVLLTSLALFTKFSKAGKGALAQGAGLALLAGAIWLLQKAVANFATMSWEEIGKGLAGVAGGLVAIGLALKLIPAKSVISAAAVLMVAASLGMIGDAIASMGSLDWGTIGKGIATLAGALVLIAAALTLLPPSTLFSAAAIFVVASSLGMISDALGQMGGMTWDEIAKGLITLAGSLGIIAAALYLMTGALPGAAATLIVAAALKMLAPVLLAFAGMSWTEIAKGLVMLAGVFVVLGVAGLALAPVTPVLLGLGLAVALFGAGVLAAAIGISIFIATMTALISAIGKVAGAVLGWLKGLGGQIPAFLGAIKSGFLVFVGFMAGLIPKLFGIAKSMFMGIVSAIGRIAPVIWAKARGALSSLISTILSFMGRMLSSGVQLASNLLNGIRNKISGLAGIASTYMGRFISTIRSFIGRALSAGKSAAQNLVNGIKGVLSGAVGQVASTARSIGSSIISGIKGALSAGIGSLKSMAENVVKAPLDAAKSFLHIGGPSKLWADEVGVAMPMGAAKGMKDNAYLMDDAATDMGDSALDSMRKALKGVSTIMEDDSVRSPVIAPVMDLSSVQAGAKDISSMLSVKPIQAKTSDMYARSSDIRYSTKPVSLIDPAEALRVKQRQESVKVPIMFNQYNTSPRALSSADIYRQTKNQISIAKGALTK